MTWIERLERRTRHSRTYEDSTQPSQRQLVATLAALHYPAVEGSAEQVTVDMTPERVQNAQLDGWRVTANRWHYALGQPAGKASDGWVGFGGRRGLHWFFTRLAKVGYLHWPSRAWQDVGGAPDYDRARLSRAVETLRIGPHDEPVHVGQRVNWSGLWSTPGGGDLSARWRLSGAQLKEELVVNAAARQWVQQNRPPTTPANETFFGFVFEVDWQDVPRVLRGGVVQDVEGDFDDAEGTAALELQDAQQRLLAYLPAGGVSVLPDGEPIRQGLRRRFWRESGQSYLLLGLRVDQLAGLPAGDLVFDPTVNEQVASNDDDGYEQNDSTWTQWNVVIGENPSTYQDRDAGLRFQAVDIAQGATITSASVVLTAFYSESRTVKATIKGIDEDDTAAWSSGSRPSQRTKTTATVDWDLPASTTANTEYTSPDLSAIIEEIVGRANWAANNDLALVIEERASTQGHRYFFYDYDENSTKAAKLSVEYTTGGGGGGAEAPIEVTGNVPVVVHGRQAVTKSSATILTDAEALSGQVLISAAVEITLPTPSADNAGADVYLSATTTNAKVKVAAGFHGVGSGADILTLTAGRGCHVYCDGSHWYLLGAGPDSSLG